MSTIPSTLEEFNKDLSKFMTITGDMSHTQEQVTGAFRAVTLRYLGLYDVTSEELENAASLLTVVSDGALARGWNLEV